MSALTQAALDRAAILHASAAWGSDGDGALLQALVEQNAELVEALGQIARLRPFGDVATAKNTRALVQQMETIALHALAKIGGDA